MAAWLWAIFHLIAAADPPSIELTGAVFLPSGEPAAGAKILGTCWHSPAARAVADREGRFRLKSEFAGPANISALSADGEHGATLSIAAQSVRRRASEPLLLKMTPARKVSIVVKKDGKPAAGVQVAHSKDEPPRRTDAQGRVVFSFPADEKYLRFSAWDSGRGVGGGKCETGTGSPLAATVVIDLQPAAATTFKAVDEFNQPVRALKLAVTCKVTADLWFDGEVFPESFGTTNDRGEWTVPWMPAKRQYPQLAPMDPAWKHDGSEDRADDATPGTLHVRRSQRVKGRVAMPLGASPENLLVEASSYGFRLRGTSSAVRVRADGTFELPVVSDHFLTIGVVDEEWTSPRHYGVLFGKGEMPKEITLTAERAMTVEVRVIAGRDKKPVANAWVQGGENLTKEWRDPAGKKRYCAAGLRQYGHTDGQGIVRFGLSREPVSFSVSHGMWREEIKAKPPRSGPFEITFHKPFVDKMRVAGQIVPPPAAPGRVELRWVAGDDWDSPAQTVPVASDGRFQLQTDKPNVRLLAIDRVGKTSAAASVPLETDSLVLSMVPSGAYGGVAKNPDGDPIPGCEVSLEFPRAKGLFSRTVKADANGKFLVEDVPAETKLSVRLNPPGLKTRYLEHGQAYVERGERYLNAVDVCSELPTTKPTRERPIAEQLAISVNDARLWHAPALVVAAGPGKEAAELVKRLANDEAYAEAERSFCFPFRITAERLAADAEGRAEFARRGWRVPAVGELMIAALSDDGKSLGRLELKAGDAEAAKKAAAFLAKFAPRKTPAVDALDAALAEARKTNRQVLFQMGGLRCGPCYRFARWIDQHRKELEKDFVLVKLSGLHTGWEAVIDRLDPKPSGGIPWTAILDPEGKVLITSDGPLGNIGFPTDRFSVRHFRKMLDAGTKHMTPQERAALVATLPKE